MADKKYSIDDILDEFPQNGSESTSGESLDDILNSYSATDNFNDSGLADFFESDDGSDIKISDINITKAADYPSQDELLKKAANITAVPDEELSEEDRIKKSKQIDYEILSGDYERKYIPDELKTSIELEAEKTEITSAKKAPAQKIVTKEDKKKKKKDKKQKAQQKKKYGLDLMDDSVSGIHSFYDDQDDFDRKYGSMPLFTDEEKNELIGEEHVIPYDISDEERIRPSGHSFSEKMELSEYDKKYASDERPHERTGHFEKITEKPVKNDADTVLDNFSSWDDVEKIIRQYDSEHPPHKENTQSNFYSGIFNKFLAKEGDESGGELLSDRVRSVPRRVPPSNAINRKQISDIDLGLSGKIIGDLPDGTPESEEKRSERQAELDKIKELQGRRKQAVDNFRFLGGEEEAEPDEVEASTETVISDYESIEDLQSISAHIEGQKTKLIVRLLILIVCFVLSTYIAIANDYSLPVLDSLKFIDKHFDTEHFLFINTIIGLVAGFTAYQTIANGMEKFFSFRADCDSLPSLALAGSLLTSMLCLMSLNMIKGSYAFVYTPVAIGSLIFNTIGKLLIISKTQRSFTHISADTPHFALFVEGDEGRVQNFTRGALTDIPVLAGMKQTEFVTNFLRTSYASDSMDIFCKKLTPAVAAAAVVLSVIAALMGHAEHGPFGAVCIALSTFSAVMNVCACFGIMLVVNLPMNEASKECARHNGAIIGYDAISEFADTNSVMCDAAQLFPSGSIRLINIKTFPDTSIDQAIIHAASVAHQSGSILRSMFYEIIGGKTEMLNPVESYLYEDSMGLTGWIDNKRVLLGNRELMINHSIEGLPSAESENELTGKGKIAVYLSISGQLSGMFIIELVPAYPIARTLHKLERAHINIMLRSVDSMLTVEKLSELFDTSPSLFKLIPSRYHEDFGRSVDYTQRSDARLACTGNFGSFTELILSTRRLRSTISIGTAMQVAQILLGILLLLALVLLNSLTQLTVTKVLILNFLFAAIYTVLAIIRKK